MVCPRMVMSLTVHFTSPKRKIYSAEFRVYRVCGGRMAKRLFEQTLSRVRASAYVFHVHIFHLGLTCRTSLDLVPCSACVVLHASHMQEIQLRRRVALQSWLKSFDYRCESRSTSLIWIVSRRSNPAGERGRCCLGLELAGSWRKFEEPCQLRA